VWDAVWLTAKLATVTTVVLILAATPLAWWLSRRGSWLRELVAAVAAMPIVLPPTVLGFYLLVALGPQSPLMAPLHVFGVRTLAFTFWGLVIGSVIYSLPFAVQPLRAAFEAVGERPLEMAASLRASPLDAFLTVELPLARAGFLTAAILVFAHTVGEFGVVLMIGGAIPKETEVLSIKIYEFVEASQYASAHLIAAGMLAFAFTVVLAMLLVGRGVVRLAP
jgi:molybdate transport system permease protein